MEAIAAVPKGGINAFRPFIYPEAALGHAYALVNRIDEAMPLLLEAGFLAGPRRAVLRP